MTHQQILEKAIQKSCLQCGKELIKDSKVQIDQWQGDGMVTIGFYNESYEYNPLTWVRELEGIIFNHDFAKALWGEDLEYVYINRGGGKPLEETLPRYKFHLQQMVIAEDPIKYLGENI